MGISHSAGRPNDNVGISYGRGKCAGVRLPYPEPKKYHFELFGHWTRYRYSFCIHNEEARRCSGKLSSLKWEADMERHLVPVTLALFASKNARGGACLVTEVPEFSTFEALVVCQRRRIDHGQDGATAARDGH